MQLYWIYGVYIMQIKTIGREVFPGVEIPLMVSKDNNAIMPVPVNTTYRLVIMDEGTGIAMSGQERAIIHGPAVFFVNEQESLEIDMSGQGKLHIIYFHPSIINSSFSFDHVRNASRELFTVSEVQDMFWLNPFLFRSGVLVSHCRISPVGLRRLYHLMDSINDEFECQQSYLWICRGRSYFFEILCYVSTFFNSKSSDMDVALENTSDIMEEALIYIHTNYSDKITINSLVKHFHLNRTTINDMFRKATGESVISYLIKLRIEASAMMLRDTGIPINEIGCRVGFDDSSHFSRTFKKTIGCSPSQYRKDNSWMLSFS